MNATDPTGGRIRIGVAGWDYPDWAGPVYPAGSGRRFDRLAYLARFVDLVEINSTFYRPNSPRAAESWLSRTEESGLRFSAKSHRSWTHSGRLDLDTDIAPTLEGLAPLRDAGRLAALLVQFPQSFRRTAAAFDRLERLLERAADWPLVVEVRHMSWNRDDAVDWFRQRNIGWCVIDQPAIHSRGSRTTLPPDPRTTSAIGYLRLHGRNERDWFRADAGRDRRYDYLYGPEELAPLADTALSLAASAAEVLVVQNNHFRGQALANTIQLKHLIHGGRPAAPQQLVEAYPELADLTTVRRERLF